MHKKYLKNKISKFQRKNINRIVSIGKEFGVKSYKLG